MGRAWGSDIGVEETNHDRGREKEKKSEAVRGCRAEMISLCQWHLLRNAPANIKVQTDLRASESI